MTIKLHNLLLAALLIAAAMMAMACSDTAPTWAADLTIVPTEAPPSLRPGISSPRPRLWPGQHLRFETISLEQGLSQSTVFCSLQDSQGFVWFGTEDGLNRYDGYTFDVWRHDPGDPNSLSDSWITALVEGEPGVLWIGTDEGGLVSYDTRLAAFTRYRHIAEDSGSLSDDRVTVLCWDRHGVLWIGTKGGVLNRLDPDVGRFTETVFDAVGLSAHPIDAICEGHDGTLWVGTDGGGLYALGPGAQQWRHYVNAPADTSSLSDNAVHAVFIDRFGMVWVGTESGGLNRLDPEDQAFIHFRHDPLDPSSLGSDYVLDILADKDGVLWVATVGGGLSRLVSESGSFDRYQSVLGDPQSVSSNIVISLYEDREGVLWIGTVGAGVNKLGLERSKFAHYVHGLGEGRDVADNMVRALLTDDDDLWVGTMAGGIDRYIAESGLWRHYISTPGDPGSLSDNWISHIYRDRSGVIWIATASGLDKFLPETETFAHFHPLPDAVLGVPPIGIRSVYEDNCGILWVGTEQGLYQFDRDDLSWDQTWLGAFAAESSLSTTHILGLYEDSEGILWVGTWQQGLYALDRSTGALAHYEHDPEDPQSLADSLVTAILEDQSGRLWVGGQAGLDLFDPGDRTFDHFDESNGLPNPTIYCILEDREGFLWMSTNKGLSRLDAGRMVFENYDVTDGLQSNEFNGNACTTCQDGRAYFGGINGYNVLLPDQIQPNLAIPPVTLTSLTQGGREVAPDVATSGLAEVRFVWPENGFEFEFAALSFARPENNQYAYYLDGFEETWREVGSRRTGQYTNLPGGTYTLRLKGSNNDGVWNKSGAAISITIVPPFWATWWFQCIAVVLFLAGVFGGYRLRVRNLEARKRQLERQVSDRTRELAALNAVVSAVSRSLDLQEVLSGALDKTLEVVNAEAGGIYLLEESTQTLVMAAHEGLGAEFVAEVDDLQVGEGFSGQVAETDKPLVVHDIAIDSRLTRSVAQEAGFHPLAIVPLVARSKVLGTLFVATRGRRQFSTDEVDLLAAIGAQVGVAVENARLYDQAQRMAIVHERQRLARDLHDSVTQSLHSSALMAEAGQRLASQGDLSRTQHYLRRLGEISQQALREMRLMVYELRPMALAQEGLANALRQRLDAVENRAGIDARLDVIRPEQSSRQRSLDATLEETLYRIAQEALNNALKHAEASEVTVRLVIGDCIELDVSDNGKGFDASASNGGIGLASMRERAQEAGGKLTVISAPGQGTTIRVTIN